jgi:carboxyl-terminal processing protease
MNRERIAWLLSFLLLGVVALRSPSAAQRDSDYLFVRTLVDIQRQVATNYVEPVDENKLEQAAIDGMLNQLDPFTNYVPPARSEDFDRMLEGTFKGIGIELNQLENGQMEVVTPIDGSPAFKAGVLAGDIILKVNGESIEGLRRPDVVKKIAETPIETEVRLRVRHESGNRPPDHQGL